jgi:hypothetical protein
MQAEWTSSTTQSETNKKAKIIPLRKDLTVENSPIIEENVVEAPGFPLDIRIPVYVNPGEKVTIRLIREQVQTTSVAQDLYTQSPKLTDLESHSPSSFNIGSIPESTDYDFLSGKEQKLQRELFKEIEKRKELEVYVEKLQERINQLNDIIKGKDNATEEVPSVQKDLSFKMINILQNIGMFLSLFLCAIFVIAFLFSLWLPKTDSLFAFILSFLGASTFYLDKLYRRSINK